ncbi:MAG: phosphocholine cytidylyltransferase family protein [Myxococcales bacterium]|nr:phosphocholine cytidylyltransferase family protein [Myxococcales bacterium]
MKAILLVAGVGRRLSNPDHPKSLLVFGGQTLLERHIHALDAAGCSHLTVVVGHQASMIRDVLGTVTAKMPITVRENPDFTEGSVVSLWVARDDLDGKEAVVVMDGDVLYPPALLTRLRDEGGPSAFLLDVRSDETGEEMMVGVKGGRARRIARRVGKDDPSKGWDAVGESVGFTKFGAEQQAALRAALEAHVAAGRRNTEYEAVYDTFLDDHPVGYVPVGDVAWTEIDFEEDVRRAREEILPHI